MCGEKNGTVSGDILERFPEYAFGTCILTRGGLIKEKDARVALNKFSNVLQRRKKAKK